MKDLIVRLKFNAGVCEGILLAIPQFAKIAYPNIVTSVQLVIDEMKDIADELERLKNDNEK